MSRSGFLPFSMGQRPSPPVFHDGRMANMAIEYIRKPPRDGLGLFIVMIGALAATAAIGLISGQINAALCWLVLACSGVPASLLLIVTVAPSVVETRVSATAAEVKVHFPWHRTRIIPFAAISNLVGVASGSGSEGNGVDFRVYWNDQSITLDEELLFKSGLFGELRNMPGFDQAAYQNACQHRPRGLELFTGGREFLLWSRANQALSPSR